MLSTRAMASKETASALEIRHGRPYLGQTFQVGDTIDICGVKVQTIPTRHTIGSCAFFWENSQGTRILVTGDVKDYRNLPRCDLLVSEANYGDPWDNSCVFDDDLDSFWDALNSGAAFGAYAFGKAQRAVSLIRGMGYFGEIGMDPESLALTEALLPSCGPLVDFRDAPGTSVVTFSNLSSVRPRERFVLTGRTDLNYRNIRLSDHLDFRGLMRMFDHLQPQGAIAYHPEGSRSRLLAHHLRQIGLDAVSVDQIEQTVP
ncbi:MAG: hypothetical protein A4E45_01609 [Methanosaeta sp. PtaB.Bin039]|nr:MAG: hypothetical protein A4E45_01609 [Methanosaeta sp. PtaB.Bin039]OPY45608.1 MAG: hypothetical protein A4E47_00918 [Methanosaeta sp. PtaU1.Bin028]